MDYSPTPLETLFLWRLLASEGGEFLQDVKPDPHASRPAATGTSWPDRIDKTQTSNVNRSWAPGNVYLADRGGLALGCRTLGCGNCPTLNRRRADSAGDDAETEDTSDRLPNVPGRFHYGICCRWS